MLDIKYVKHLTFFIKLVVEEKIKKTCIFIFLTLFSVSALAVNIENIDIGDVYYLSKLGNNIPVQIIRIDRSYSKVKIRKEGGFTDWVHTSRLLKESENTMNEAAEGAAWIIGGAVILCVLSDECKNHK